MTEFRVGDLVALVPAHRARYFFDIGEVGLVVELQEPPVRITPLVGVVWPHVATIRWYRAVDLVKVTG